MNDKKIIDGNKIANRIKDEIVAEILSLGGQASFAERPGLAIILVGERKDSEIYVSLKEKEARKVGIDTSLYKFSAAAEQKEIEEAITFLNNDPKIDGLLLQLPLPEKFDTDTLIKMIAPAKDVDRFHPDNLRQLSNTCDFGDEATPPLIQVIFEVLAEAQIDPAGKKVCALVNSDILGDSLKKTLECRGANVQIARADDQDFPKKSREADILISAVGRPKFLKKEHIKEGCCLIDIGISQLDGKTCGDADFSDVIDKVGFITPVPGGVGPITIATALRNTLWLYKKNRKSL